MLTKILQGVNLFPVDKTPTQNIEERTVNLVVDTQMLEGIISASGKKKSYLASKLGISVQSLKLKIDNKFDFKTTEVSILCQELDITRLTDKEKIFFKL